MFIHEVQQNILMVHFQENLIMPTLDTELQEVIENAIASGQTDCIINLAEVQYANSSGIGILMRILAKFRNANGEVVLVNPSAHLQKLLIITKLTAIFMVADNMDEAIQQFKK